MNTIFGNDIPLVSRAMDFLWERQEVAQNNIANVDTPGFKARYVRFEDDFKQHLDKAMNFNGSAASVSEAIQDSNFVVEKSKNQTARLDGNSVNADSEFIEMTRTALQYQYLMKAMNSNFASLRSVIKGQ